MTRNVGCSVEQLSDPASFIDWPTFLTVFSSLGSYLPDEQLFAAGSASWRHEDLRVYAVTGRMLHTVQDQYSRLFGETGLTTTMYPLHLDLALSAPGHLTLRLSMQDSLTPCRPFHHFLAGQLAAVPLAMGENEADVIVQHYPDGATFDVDFEASPGLVSRLYKALTWPFVAREGSRQLSRAYDLLVQQHRELAVETTRSIIARQRATELEARHRLLEENINDVIWLLDARQRFQSVSPSVHSLLGYSPAEIQGRLLDDFLTRESKTLVDSMNRAAAANDGDPETSLTLEVQMLHKRGHSVWTEVRATLIRDEDGRLLHLVGVAQDISDRKQYENDLKEREQTLRAITTSARDGIVIVDQGNRITFANPAMAKMLGVKARDLIEQPLHHFIPDAHHGTLEKHKQPVGAAPLALAATHGGGQALVLEASTASHTLDGEQFVTWILRDVSARSKVEDERQALERQLQAAQRMESIGQLTGGIAHDFNNLLVAINGYAELAMSEGLARDKLVQYLAEIRRAGDRAADMTHKLLAFSRRQIIEPRPLAANQLINGIERIIDRLLPEDIDVRFIPNLHDPWITADAGQIEQVVINLAVNARDAMKGGGRLTIGVEERSLSAANIDKGYQRPGDFVVIRVEDNGTGMNDEVKKRVFEPFFTTKPEGSGTGLGLAVVFGIVKQHEGFIEIDSIEGRGSRFEIWLPLTEYDGLAPQQVKTRQPSAGGRETLLLVEDNKHVRDLARLILDGAGYEVIEATDGIEALAAFRRNESRIGLVIMDVVMPRMGGREVMNQIRAIRPHTRILFSSGYSSGGIHTDFILEEGLEFIAKPYGADELRSRVRSILDQA